MRNKGFTLIELLIVVAIIGILAAIAVPNFMNAQTRAKIARQYSDMKAVCTGIEQLKMDKGVMLVDFWDDDNQWGLDRIKDVFNNVGNVGEANRRMIHVLAPLTSPVSYLSTIPKDPFASKINPNISSGNSERYGIWGNDTYLYVDWDLQWPNGAPGNAGYGGYNSAVDAASSYKWYMNMRIGDYVLFGFGPAAPKTYSATDMGVRCWIPYDASNGLSSIGDIMMKNDSVWK